MEEQQGKDLRYNIEHLGDVVVEIIEGFGFTITKGFRGIWLTRNIQSAKRDRNNVVYRIGEEVVSIRKDQADLLADKETMVGLFTEFDDANMKLEDIIDEREKRLDRIRGKIKKAAAVKEAAEMDEMPDYMAAAPA
jgi:hypothetical protein